MISNNPHEFYSIHQLYNAIQIDDRIIYPNDSELYRLVKKTTGVKNSTKKKVNPATENNSVKKGLLKSLLIGIAVLRGIGTGTYYAVGRQIVALLENNSSSPSVMEDITPGKMDSLPSTSVSHIQMAIMNSSRTTETTSSPYSYYENIYGDTAVKNKAMSSIPVITTEASTIKKNPVIRKEIIKRAVMAAPADYTSPHVKTEPATIPLSHDTTENTVTEYKHERGRSIYYQSIKKKGNYPLGTKFFNKLTGFCFADPRRLIEQANTASPNLRCELLSRMVEKIEMIKEEEILLQKIHASKETLSAEEYDEEILTRRKLTTFYLAAETIIDKKDFFTFYQKATNDYREYSTQELMQREEKIRDYFPKHDAMGECEYR